MHIVIGGAPPANPKASGSNYGGGGGVIEAKVLDIRPPRRKKAELGPKERRKQNNQDPVNGRVLVLLAQDGHNLPPDADSGNYRVFLKFVPR